MDYLADYAVKNIWCSPGQDKQFIFKLRRITPYNGFNGSWKFLMTSVYAPENTGRFHLFQIGSVYPDMIDLVSKQGTWVKLSESAAAMRTVVDLYFDSGVKIPVSSCYFTYTEERCLLIAVKELTQVGKINGYDTLCDYPTNNVYMRVYKNSYFETSRWLAAQTAAHMTVANPVFIQGSVIASTNDTLAYQTLITTLRTQPGAVAFYRNGFRIYTVDLTTISIGDYLEVVYDGSVIRSDTLNFVTSTPTFTSTLDSQTKYLLHLPVGASQTINYQDDVDLYLYHPTLGISLYLHKNAPATLRNLTHQDYSLRADSVTGLITTSKGLFTANAVKVNLISRNSGYQRTLVDEHHRIKELYKLADAKISQAMIGVNSTVTEWTANSLESSAYPALMSSNYRDINKAQTVAAMGYNALAKLTGSSVSKLTVLNTPQDVPVPVTYQTSSSVFFYDVQGLLLNRENHAGTPTHVAPANTGYVEFVKGAVSDSFDEYLDQPTTHLEVTSDYKFYVRPKTSNPQVNEWVDCTGDTTKVVVIDGVATWLSVRINYNTLIRSNKGFLWQTKTFDMVDGLMVFDMSSMIMENGVMVERVLEVPPGELDLFLNGRSLIYGLDFFVNFPTVTIVNKDYIAATGPQVVNVRMKGLCNSDMSFSDTNEYGFMVGGRLSVDHVFDIRDDKTLRMQISGRLIVPGDAIFNENTTGYVTNNAWEGRPYQVKDVVIPLKDLTGVDTLALRASSKAVDKKVSDYLTRFTTLPTHPPLTTIPALYKVYSPLICKIAMDLKSGVLTSPILTQQYTDAQVDSVITPYKYLYSMDPIHPDLRPPAQYVTIHPTHMQTQLTLDIWQYTFLSRVVRLLAQDAVVLSGSITIA